MKINEKKWLAGFMAAGLFFAAGNLVSANAPAVQGGSEHVAPASSFTGEKAPCMQASHGLFMIGETADLLDVGLRELKEQMEQGKTLAQIAKERKGWSESQLLEKLKPTLSQRLDKAANEGCLTKEQAAAAKQSMDQKLLKVIRTPLKDLRREFAGIAGKKPPINHKVIAEFIGITPEELQKQLQSGKSLAEVAKAHGISETQLIDKLKEQLTDDLQRLVHRKGWARPAPHDRAPGHPAGAEAK
ncbi:hypothetical protein MKY59_05605 [Paenibacillus sp. FSL W8-0426]|uniref:hypothetical protein n=1 Tax=Paenibacillus sp. FSL W8-0426 TaxID=2921714 RepID=UPI0030D6E714